MTGYLHENRVYVHPRTDGVQKGDHVILSDYNIPWNITKISRDGTLHLESLSGWGKRKAIESVSRVKAAWRDPDQAIEIDWSQAYEEEL